MTTPAPAMNWGKEMHNAFLALYYYDALKHRGSCPSAAAMRTVMQSVFAVRDVSSDLSVSAFPRTRACVRRMVGLSCALSLNLLAQAQPILA
eukprot:7376166-Prymnesium_polylepis.2